MTKNAAVSNNADEAESSVDSDKVEQKKPRAAKASTSRQAKEMNSKKAPAKNSKTKKLIKDHDSDDLDGSDDSDDFDEALCEDDIAVEDENGDDSDKDYDGGGLGDERDPEVAAKGGVPPRPTRDRRPDVKPPSLPDDIWDMLRSGVVPPPHSEEAYARDPSLLLGT